MKKAIFKTALRTDLPAITIKLTPDQHATVQLAIQHLLATIDGADYDQLEQETANGFGRLRTHLFGVASMLRHAERD